MASARTRSILPSFISAASTLRPVGLMRSPMITKGRWPEITTSRRRELSRVSILALTLFQGLVDQLDRLLQGLRALRLSASIADELLGHPGGHRGIGRIAVRADVLGVLLGHRRAADRDVHLVSKPGLGQGVDVDLEHGHGGRQESGEADHVGLVLLDGGDELLGWSVHAEVVDLETGALDRKT